MRLTPPTSYEAEESLLGACIAAQLPPPCDPGDFTCELHQTIAKAMHELDAKGLGQDLVLISKRVEELSGKAYGSKECAHVATTITNDSNLETYARVVTQYSRARQMQRGAVNLISQLSENFGAIDEIMDRYVADVLTLSDGGMGAESECTAKQGMVQLMRQLEARYESKSQLIGLPYGLRKLDMLTCGMEPQEYVVLAARPSMGKTLAALQITRHVADRGKRVLWFSLDMSKEGLFQRLVASGAKVNLQQIRNGQMSGQEYARVSIAATKLAELDIVVCDTPCTELDILRKTRKVKPDLVVVDFLQKIKPLRRSSNRVADYTEVSASMKNTLKELDIPGLVLCQLSRDNEKESRRPKLSDLRETGAIEQDADTVIFLHAKNKTDPTREIIIDKQRQGECALFEVAFVGEYQRFEELAYEN